MRRTAIKYIYPASFFYVRLKKHACPNCGEKLKIGYTSEIVNSESLRAENYDFSNGETFFAGDVEFRTRCFHCVHCKKNISIQEMKQHEQAKGHRSPG